MLGPAYAWVVIGDGAFTYYPLPVPEFRKLSLFKGTLAEVFVSEECEVHDSQQILSGSIPYSLQPSCVSVTFTVFKTILEALEIYRGTKSTVHSKS